MAHRSSVSLDDGLWERVQASGRTLPDLVARGIASVGEGAEAPVADDQSEQIKGLVKAAGLVVAAAEDMSNAFANLMKLLDQEGYEIVKRQPAFSTDSEEYRAHIIDQAAQGKLPNQQERRAAEPLNWTPAPDNGGAWYDNILAGGEPGDHDSDV